MLGSQSNMVILSASNLVSQRIMVCRVNDNGYESEGRSAGGQEDEIPHGLGSSILDAL